MKTTYRIHNPELLEGLTHISDRGDASLYSKDKKYFVFVRHLQYIDKEFVTVMQLVKDADTLDDATKWVTAFKNNGSL